MTIGGHFFAAKSIHLSTNTCPVLFQHLVATHVGSAFSNMLKALQHHPLFKGIAFEYAIHFTSPVVMFLSHALEEAGLRVDVPAESGDTIVDAIRSFGPASSNNLMLAPRSCLDILPLLNSLRLVHLDLAGMCLEPTNPVVQTSIGKYMFSAQNDPSISSST